MNFSDFVHSWFAQFHSFRFSLFEVLFLARHLAINTSNYHLQRYDSLPNRKSTTFSLVSILNKVWQLHCSHTKFRFICNYVAGVLCISNNSWCFVCRMAETRRKISKTSMIFSRIWNLTLPPALIKIQGNSHIITLYHPCN